MRPFRIFTSIFLTATFWGIVSPASATDFPFSDVSSSDSIYPDLKRLYERGVIDVPSDGKFHPEALMDRDEFVSIAVGVGCKKCLIPTVEDVLKYREIPFLDFEKKSPYFYCVSHAKERGIVFGYSIPGNSSYACQDGKSWEGVPFCAKNRTSRIEAAAMLLRQAGLWDDAANSENFQKKYEIADVSGYWYGYAQKGIEAGILSLGSNKTLRPDEYVTKREFVKMAAVTYSLNLCDAKSALSATSDFSAPSSETASPSSMASSDSVASEIRIQNAAESCSDSGRDSRMDDPNATEYNFFGMPAVPGGNYVWEFVPADGTGTILRDEGRCLVKKNLPAGRWIAKLRVTDSSGRSASSYAEVPFWPGTKIPLSLSVRANPLSVPSAMPVTFSSFPSGGTPPYSFRWDLGDGTFSGLSDPRHSYLSAKTHPVTLMVTDSEWSRAIAKIVVSVTENPDLDGDGILNSADSCPFVKGPKSAFGCPSVVEFSSSDDVSWILSGANLSLSGVGGACQYSFAAPKGAIFGKASCDSCPCAYEVDFLAEARRCDIFFPAILSPDKSSMYGRGALFELRQ